MSIIAYVLFVLFTQVQCQRQSPPTQEEICADPMFDAALAVDHSNDSTWIMRYLFRGQYVMTYLFDAEPKTIVWQNISLIVDLFKDMPMKNLGEGVQMAFEVNGHVYLTLRSDPDKFLRFTVKGRSFRLTGQGDLSQLGFIYMKWNVQSIDLNGQQLNESFYYIDYQKPLSTQAPPTAYSIGMGSTKFIITINADNQTMKINDKNPLVILHSELSPIIMMYNNNEKRIPILFDAYYHTNFSETIFFRGNAACVSMFYSHNIWEDTQYCRKYVDTRSIIGCATSQTESTSGPETDPDEPEDTEPDM